MSIIRTDLGETRERAREVRFEQVSVGPISIAATDVQEAIEETASELSAMIAGALRIVTAAGPVTVSSTEGGVAINKTVGAATAVALPPAASRNGLPVTVKDMKGDAATNNITVSPDAGDVLGIDGFATDVLDINGSARTYRPISGGWLIT